MEPLGKHQRYIIGALSIRTQKPFMAVWPRAHVEKMATNINANGNELPPKEEDVTTKDIDKYYLKDLNCQIRGNLFLECGKPLRFLRYDRFSDKNGHHFIVARMWCDEHKDTWIQPPAKERIYLDGPDASFIKNLESVHNTLSLLASTMEGKEVPLSWNLSMDFWGFREDFSDAVKAKLQILRDFEEAH